MEHSFDNEMCGMSKVGDNGEVDDDDDKWQLVKGREKYALVFPV